MADGSADGSAVDMPVVYSNLSKCCVNSSQIVSMNVSAGNFWVKRVREDVIMKNDSNCSQVTGNGVRNNK